MKIIKYIPVGGNNSQLVGSQFDSAHCDCQTERSRSLIISYLLNNSANALKYLLILFVFLVTSVSCEKPIIEKPKNLIKEDKMIEILVDAHLAEAAFNLRRARDSMVMNSSSENFYYSVLQDHQVPDSLFEKSYVYYASFPKKFEKMYQDVMNKLNEMEQQFSGRKTEELELGTEKKK